MKNKIKKSTWVSLALFVYVTVMAAYFLPRNTEMGSTEKYIMVGVAYLIVVFLWLVSRKREKLAARREEDMRRIKNKDKE